jgi:hypothetical protein
MSPCAREDQDARRLATIPGVSPATSPIALARKPRMLVIVALANKLARIVWALMKKGGVYKATAVIA